MLRTSILSPWNSLKFGDIKYGPRFPNTFSSLGLDTRNRYRCRNQQKEKTMNPEHFVIEAGNAIAEFSKTHDCTCFLNVSNGKVYAACLREATIKPPASLVLTRFQQTNGVVSSRWSLIGKDLLNLYNEEKLCQTLQKP